MIRRPLFAGYRLALTSGGSPHLLGRQRHASRGISMAVAVGPAAGGGGSYWDACWRFLTLAFLRQHPQTGGLQEDRSSMDQKRSEYLSGEHQMNSVPLKWLPQVAPCFPVCGDQVHLLETPSDFYSALVSGAQRAKKRITLASLYLGTGPLERSFVATIQQSLASKKSLQVKFLLDCTRGSRGEKVNSRTMLLPLLHKWPQSCQVSLFHTPQLRGMSKRWIPQRYNELIGLQHMKVYVFDDDVLISGANLSQDYFTQRQDRYLLICNCPPLADFYDGLISTVSNFCLHLDSTNRLATHPEWKCHPTTGDQEQFIHQAGQLVTSFLERSKTVANAPEGADTWVFPLVQMGPFGVRQDENATRGILASVPSTSLLATGYFNLTPAYQSLLLAPTASKFRILMAHPTANGFYGASWPLGAIPSLYTLVASQFFTRICEQKCEAKVKLMEFSRPGWTFHAKGLWASLPGKQKLTLLGSPNFGHRSVERDLETQVALITSNTHLQEAIQEEADRLCQHAEQVTQTTFDLPERRVPLWVYLVAYFCRDFF